MSTHTIGFYEDLTKIIFQLSSNIIKNAPYLFWYCLMTLANICIELSLSFKARDATFFFVVHVYFFSFCQINFEYIDVAMFEFVHDVETVFAFVNC